MSFASRCAFGFARSLTDVRRPANIAFQASDWRPSLRPPMAIALIIFAGVEPLRRYAAAENALSDFKEID